MHDYLLGGRPSLGDFGLIGPLYAHLYRDAVAGFALRTFFPVVGEWVERANGEGALNARRYGQKLYSLDADGALVGRIASSDGGEWLGDDAIPETLIDVLRLFFDEMWPVLAASARVLTDYIESDAHDRGGELPGKTFTATPGFTAEQSGDGPLTHPFRIGGVESRRMVVPYQIWMLQRLEAVLDACVENEAGRASLLELLDRFERGPELLSLDTLLAGCRIRKEGARLYSVPR